MDLTIILRIAILALLVLSPSVSAQRVSNIPNSGKPSLCDLERRPKSFLGSVVAIDAIHVTGLESFWLEEDCVCYKFDDEFFKIKYVFDEDFEINSDSKTLKRFRELLNSKQKRNRLKASVGVRYEVVVQEYHPNNPGDNMFEYVLRIMKIISITEA